jgi:hypothetical protein
MQKLGDADTLTVPQRDGMEILVTSGQLSAGGLLLRQLAATAGGREQ